MIRMIVLLVCAALLLGQMHPFPGPGRASTSGGGSSATIIETDTGNYNIGSTRTWTVAGTTTGDYILVMFANEEDLALTSVTDTLKNVYTLVQEYTTSDRQVYIYYAVAGSTGSNNVTITYASSTVNYFSCLLVRGAIGIDDSDKVEGVGANPSVTLTTTLDNVLLAGIYIGSTDPTAQSGFTTLHDSAYNNFSLAEYDVTNSTGSNPVGVTAGSNQYNRFLGVAVK